MISIRYCNLLGARVVKSKRNFPGDSKCPVPCSVMALDTLIHSKANCITRKNKAKNLNRFFFVYNLRSMSSSSCQLNRIIRLDVKSMRGAPYLNQIAVA